MTNAQQLLLDQPDTITTRGKIERVLENPKGIPLNDNTGVQKTPTDLLLLTEDPLDGVEIILG
jgi:hypothetical protein